MPSWAAVEERPFQGRVAAILRPNAALKAPLFHGTTAASRLNQFPRIFVQVPADEAFSKQAPLCHTLVQCPDGPRSFSARIWELFQASLVRIRANGICL